MALAGLGESGFVARKAGAVRVLFFMSSQSGGAARLNHPSDEVGAGVPSRVGASLGAPVASPLVFPIPIVRRRRVILRKQRRWKRRGGLLKRCLEKKQDSGCVAG
jgi:hypothetical protein